MKLRHATPAAWVRVVEDDLDRFLQDHAANERKVSHSALSLATQHPERDELVALLIDVACEELDHFRQVYALLRARGVGLGQDGPDPYIGALRKHAKNADVDLYLRDRLIVFGIIEARGRERFQLLANHLSDPELRDFYAELARCEARHHATYLRLARSYFDADAVALRLDELLTVEAQVVAQQPLAPRLFA